MLACTNSQQKVRFITDKEEYILWKKKARRMGGGNKEELEGKEYRGLEGPNRGQRVRGFLSQHLHLEPARMCSQRLKTLKES